jgi:hypothetical protein
MWMQHELTLAAKPRGFHLVTREVLTGLPGLESACCTCFCATRPPACR